MRDHRADAELAIFLLALQLVLGVGSRGRQDRRPLQKALRFCCRRTYMIGYRKAIWRALLRTWSRTSI